MKDTIESGQARSLQDLARAAFERDPYLPIIEFDKRWYTWGELRHVADRLRASIEASGAEPSATVAFTPRNHPAALAALLGLIADGRTIKMIYAFQSAAGITRDLKRLKPSIFVAASRDLSDVVRETARAEGIAVVALDEGMGIYSTVPTLIMGLRIVHVHGDHARYQDIVARGAVLTHGEAHLSTRGEVTNARQVLGPGPQATAELGVRRNGTEPGIPRAAAELEEAARPEVFAAPYVVRTRSANHRARRHRSQRNELGHVFDVPLSQRPSVLESLTLLRDLRVGEPWMRGQCDHVALVLSQSAI